MTLPRTVSPTAPTLRSYQREALQQIYYGWQHHQNVLAVLPTGAGKTVLFSHVMANHGGASVAIAHRKELIEQISLALARAGVRHRIVAPNEVIRAISARHVQELGVSFYDSTARAGVASVDSMRSKGQLLVHGRWLKTCTLWVGDEYHHFLRDNKWGKALAGALDLANPAVKGLGVTATAGRSDGAGLGRHADGLIDYMWIGPVMRDLIQWGFLTDADVVMPLTHIALTDDMIGAKGDYTLDRGKGKAAVRQSKIVGDTVDNYVKFASGKLAIVFASDLETAADMAARFRERGIPAEMVDGTTHDDARRSAINRFRAGQLRVLVNVDLFGEGFDLPAIECVIMARPTKSFPLFAQMWGRVARLMIGAELQKVWDSFTDSERLARIAASPKPRGLIIDQVGNLLEFRGPPDTFKGWTLDRADRKSAGPSDAIALRACLNPSCQRPFRRVHYACPHCGWEPDTSTSTRQGPQYVDGDLGLVPPEVLDQMRAAVQQAVLRTDAEIRVEMLHKFASNVAIHGAIAHAGRLRETHARLIDLMAWWAGDQARYGLTDIREIQRLFWHRFGVDMLTCQAWKRPEMEALCERIESSLTHETKQARLAAVA